MGQHPEMPSPGGNRGKAGQQAETRYAPANHTTVIALPRPRWRVAMRRAYAIGEYRGRAKILAVRHWRVAVVDALEMWP